MHRHEAQLAAERDSNLRLKGENGIMKKRFNSLQREIAQQKAAINQLFIHKKELYTVTCCRTMQMHNIFAVHRAGDRATASVLRV